MGDSSGDEVDDLVYGMNDDDAAGNRNGVVSDALSRGKGDLYDRIVREESEQVEDDSAECVPRYSKNPKKPVKEDPAPLNEDEGGDLDDLLNLIESQDDEEEKQSDSEPIEGLLELMEKENVEDDDDIRPKDDIKLKRADSAKVNSQKSDSPSQKPSQSTESIKSSITISKCSPDEKVFTEKHTRIRLNKCNHASETELNAMLACSYGKFYKLTELARRTAEIKDPNADWFTIVIIGGKTDSKCSAKGNSYIIWNCVDLNCLERQQDISMFLFGSAYKSHWKSTEFQTFAVIKPEFLNNDKDSGNNNSGAKNGKTGWNTFAAKKVNNQIPKLTLSVKSESQLVYLGVAKDISYCQSYTKLKSSEDQAKKCKNLVNLSQQSSMCVFHCIKAKQSDAAKGKYSMNGSAGVNPRSHLLPNTSLPPNAQFIKPSSSLNSSPFTPAQMREQTIKMAKDMKANNLRSLNASITQELSNSSPVLANRLGATGKKSDMETMAMLEGRKLEKEELEKIRLTEQQTITFHGGSVLQESNKEIKKLFNSKILLKGDLIGNASVSSQKLTEMKREGLLAENPDSLASKLKVSYEHKKSNFNLVAKQSHREIVKELKKKENSKETPREEAPAPKPVVAPPQPPKKPGLIACDFLKNRINEIKKFNKPATSLPSSPSVASKAPPPKVDIGFDLELYIGDSPTTKKLLDTAGKFVGVKRKIDDNEPAAGPAASQASDAKAKKLKLIEELQGIKSNHSKDVMDPEKNPHLKSYLDRLQQQEDIDNKLTSIRNREVSAVTCNKCSYTAFSQSNYCKDERHPIVRRSVLQRFFRCKECKERTYTLDKLYPTLSCSKCGLQRFEPCAMKEDTSAANVIINKSSALDIDSELVA